MNDPRFSFLSDVTDADEETLQQLLSATTVRIKVSSQASSTFAGQVLVYQLATLLARLFDRVELSGDEEVRTHRHMVLLKGAFLPELRRLLPTLRRTGDVLPKGPRTVEIVVGADVGSAAGASTDKEPANLEGHPDKDVESFSQIFVGATGWSARVSTLSPQAVADTANPVGALAAAAIGASEVFKAVFGARIQGMATVDEYSLSLLDYEVVMSAEDKAEIELPQHIDIDTVLFGCGSIGCGLVLGLLLTSQLRGKLVAVDKEGFDTTNPYKYALLNWAAASSGVYKAVWVQQQLRDYAKERLDAQAFVGTAEVYVASLEHDYAIHLAVSAVDTLESRFEIQDTLPRKVLNAGIDGTLAEVSTHGFGEGPCLACMVVAAHREARDAKPIAERLGLPVERVVHMIDSNEVLTTADIEQIKAHGKLSPENMRLVDSYIGKHVLSLWNRAAYSEATLQIEGGSRMRVTTAFVSAFAGTMLLAELIKASVPALQAYGVNNSYRHELLGIPIGGAFKDKRDATGSCLCHSSFRLTIYDEKYGQGGPLANRYAA
jgi:hypothetical protein